MLSLTSMLSLSATDLARPLAPTTAAAAPTQLSSSPNIWLTHDFLSAETVKHMLSKIPKEESAYTPCIGQVEEFDSKKCTYLPAQDDPVVEALLAKVEHTWNVDVEGLKKEGLPIIRYLPGAPPVGKHGDEDRHGNIPNATLVMYLTASDATSAGPTGQTIFPEAKVTVTPTRGSVLSFQNVDDAGAVHPNAKHLVSAVPKEAAGDRLVVQIPIAHKDGVRAYAYPEHVSGPEKQPGEHCSAPLYEYDHEYSY